MAAGEGVAFGLDEVARGPLLPLGAKLAIFEVGVVNAGALGVGGKRGVVEGTQDGRLAGVGRVGLCKPCGVEDFGGRLKHLLGKAGPRLGDERGEVDLCPHSMEHPGDEEAACRMADEEGAIPTADFLLQKGEHPGEPLSPRQAAPTKGKGAVAPLREEPLARGPMPGLTFGTADKDKRCHARRAEPSLSGLATGNWFDMGALLREKLCARAGKAAECRDAALPLVNLGTLHLLSRFGMGGAGA